MTSSRIDSWAEFTLTERLEIVKRARKSIAATSLKFADAISPELQRAKADTLAAEVLPLLAACRFLEKEAERILAPRKLGRRGMPFWLFGVENEVRRVSFGRILIIGPANYPLLLPGVQSMQALTAGNSVVWKPGHGGRAIADLMAQTLYDAGLPRTALTVTDESVEAANREIDAGVDKVIFTGSVRSGRQLLARLSSTVTPSVAELSGCDGVIVLPSADLQRVVKALLFGMRLNGSATCMAPRRVLLVDAAGDRRSAFWDLLKRGAAQIEKVPLPEQTRTELAQMIAAARESGAVVVSELQPERTGPVLIDRVSPDMLIAQADIFAPVLSVADVIGLDGVVVAQRVCPFGLGCSIFGSEDEARNLAERLDVGSVSINDLIVPSADPRVPFGGRRLSGFGTTRGREGLLEMTAVQTVAVRRSSNTRHLEPTGESHTAFFQAIIGFSHGATLRERFLWFRRMIGSLNKVR